MPMTTEAAQLHTMHTRKSARLFMRLDEMSMNLNTYDKQRLFRHCVKLCNKHIEAARAIYNCPESWERSETDRKLAEIKAYLGQPLYDEWLEAGAAENFEKYVADEYEKITTGAYATIRGSWDKFMPDPRSRSERLHDEAGEDLQRMNTDQRNGG